MTYVIGMGMGKSLLLLGFACVMMTGCATDPFAKYYQGYTNQMPAYLHQQLLPPSPNPQVIVASAPTFKDEERRLEERGLVILGSASFWGFKPTQEQLVRQAKKVGADTAIWASGSDAFDVLPTRTDLHDDSLR